MAEKKTITFVTKNKEKKSDIKKMLGNKFDIQFTSDLDLTEIQSLSVEEVVAFKVKQAYEKVGTPIAVSDSGLEIESLKNFPGALVKFVNETIGQEGITKLLENVENRNAHFVAAIGFCDHEKNPIIFVERDKGTISLEPRGDGWHFDRIFIPKGEKRTWAEIGRERKNIDSAFRRALEKMSQWLAEKGP